MIEHLILSGGGHNIITICGALTYLKKENYIDFNNLLSIDATSAGSLLAFALLIGIDSDELENYMINRPWEKVFDITPDIIFKTFNSKGLFDRKIFEDILEPIVNSCGVEMSITLKELYERTRTDFYIYSTELNTLELVTLSHNTNPDMLVIDAIYMSCAIPPLFKPVVYENNCYLDGGIFANYPLHCFLERVDAPDLSKVFGVKLKYEQIQQDNIQDGSNITEYIFTLVKKLIQHIIIHREHQIDIPNELLIYSKGMSFETLKRSIYSQKERETLLGEGRRYASVYHIYKEKVTHSEPSVKIVEESQIPA